MVGGGPLTSPESSDIALEDTFVRIEGHLEADLGDENVILTEEEGVYYGMDGVGPEIWTLLGDPRSGEDLVEAIVSEYEVAEERVREDVRRFLAELVAEGLVEVVEPG